MKPPIFWLKVQYRFWLTLAKWHRLSADLRMDCLRMAMKFSFEILRRESKDKDFINTTVIYGKPTVHWDLGDAKWPTEDK